MENGTGQGLNGQRYLTFVLNRLRERLWVKPLIFCVLSIALALIAGLPDFIQIDAKLPEVSATSIETLLKIISSSMLVISMFAAGAMLSAYNSASNIATPRSFSLIIADDVSQNALSTFLGAFIFSIIGLVALLNNFYGPAGRFSLFIMVIVVFTGVILSFVRWVDRIARLGRLGTAVRKVESATESAIKARAGDPAMGAALASGPASGTPIYSDEIGYVQRIDILKLQNAAKTQNLTVRVAALQGTFICPGKPVAYINSGSRTECEHDPEPIRKAFQIGKTRTFDEDPRFGLIVLSEIASRALSPAVNDPGSAIDVISSYVRLFSLWSRVCASNTQTSTPYGLVEMPVLSLEDMFEDAFSALARDGASMLEVATRTQKALNSLSQLNDDNMTQAASQQAKLALSHALHALRLEEEKEALKAVSNLTLSDHRGADNP